MQKINISTELKLAFTDAIRSTLTKNPGESESRRYLVGLFGAEGSVKDSQ